MKKIKKKERDEEKDIDIKKEKDKEGVKGEKKERESEKEEEREQGQTLRANLLKVGYPENQVEADIFASSAPWLTCNDCVVSDNK